MMPLFFTPPVLTTVVGGGQNPLESIPSWSGIVLGTGWLGPEIHFSCALLLQEGIFQRLECGTTFLGIGMVPLAFPWALGWGPSSCH